MKNLEKVLNQYWGYTTFRHPQKQVIEHVLNKKDTIALLPTGGGKSLCFQVPTLLLKGVCIVISPLTALIEDQIKSLTKRNIKAVTIKSGSSENEIITLFDNIKFGNFKFLYLSPERLASKLVQQKIKELDICLFAIDEAHCISEWGHDFRPSYRQIAVLKEIQPSVNIIALTATANARVLDDIATNLELQEPKIVKKSFYRENLAYQVFHVDNKLLRLKQIFTKTKTPAIVYVSSRRRAEEISNFLIQNNFKSTFYHGGLTPELKQNAYKKWMSEENRIIVATNAFGMGIDKENVGIVVHYDFPFSIENYIQEAGRAGRNQQKSFAVLLKNEHDINVYKQRQKKALPTFEDIKMVHRKLYQYLDISYGAFSENSFPFDLQEFCARYEFNPVKTRTILFILANHNIIDFSKTEQKKSTVFCKASSKTVLNYAIDNIYFKKFIDSLLRTYTGLFNQSIYIDEFLLAKKNNCTSKQVKEYLQQMHNDNILTYTPSLKNNEIQFLVPREDDRTLSFHAKEIKQYLKLKSKKETDLLNYINNNTLCRSIQILQYFNEKNASKCGKCDVCLNENKNVKKVGLKNQIVEILKKNKQLTSQEIVFKLNAKQEEVLVLLRELLNEDVIGINLINKYHLKTKK